MRFHRFWTPSRARVPAVSLWLLLVVAMLAPRAARAYPQWQFSSGATRCNQCHFSPAGGGLINGYARDALGDELSTWTGNGAFAHGVVGLPGWLALGADVRGAFLRYDAGNPEGADTAVFPMQADLQARVAFLDVLSVSATVGYRGQVRERDAPLGSNNFKGSAASSFVSREHYLMWRQSALGAYARIGRFFPPYGLRLAEHPMYIRRDLGTNLLEETYGLSGGVVKADWDLHLTGFFPDPLQQFGGREQGAAALFERRLLDKLALGLSGRAGFADDHQRYMAGGFGKLYLAAASTLLMAEADLVNWRPDTAGAVNQLVGYLSLTVFPYKGVWLGAFGELFRSDIDVDDTATPATGAQLNWFPYPHFELVILGRWQLPAGQDATTTLLVQLHYIL